jgi:hypothetical protein
MKLIKLLVFCGVSAIVLVAAPPLWASLKAASAAALVFAAANPLLVGMGALCLVLAIVSASLNTPPPPRREPVWNRNVHRPWVRRPSELTPPVYTPTSRFKPLFRSTRVPASTLTPDKPKSFEERLGAISHKEELFEEFYDPISLELMENPVNAITEIYKEDGSVLRVDYILDQSTYNTLKYHMDDARLPKRLQRREQPNNRLPIEDCIPCSELKATIDEVIKVLEENAADCKPKPSLR